MQERRVDQARELGRIAGILETMQQSISTMADKFDGLQTIMSEHVRDDMVAQGSLRKDVDDLQEWRDGRNGSAGAEDQLQEIRRQRYWLMGIVSGLGLGGSALGTWLSKLIGSGN